MPRPQSSTPDDLGLDLGAIQNDVEQTRRWVDALAAFGRLLAQAQRLQSFLRAATTRLTALEQEHVTRAAQLEIVRQQMAQQGADAETAAAARIHAAEADAHKQIETIRTQTTADLARAQKDAATEQARITSQREAVRLEAQREQQALDHAITTQRDTLARVTADLERVTEELTDRRETLRGQVTKAEQTLAALRNKIQQAKTAIAAIGVGEDA